MILFPLLIIGWAGFLNADECRLQHEKFIGTRCYIFVSKRHTYEAAKKYCHSQGYSLATVDTAITARFLASSATTEFGSNTGQFWIGLSREKDYELFFWDDGTNVAYTNFEAGFPNRQNYVAENVKNGRWQTFEEHKELEFVCSYDISSTTTSAPTTTRSIVTTKPFSTTATRSIVTTKPFSTTATRSIVTTKPFATTATRSIVTTKPFSTTATRSIVTTKPFATTATSWKSTRETSVAPTTGKKACPRGFTLLEETQKCYIVLVYGNDTDYPYVPNDAPFLTRENQRCAKYGATVATIHSSLVNDLFRSLIYDRFYDSRYATIGLRNSDLNAVGGKWQWYDGTLTNFLNFGNMFPKTGDYIAQTSSQGFWVSYTRTAPNEGVVCSVDY